MLAKISAPLLELVSLLLWSARRARNVVWNRFWSSCLCCFGPQGVLETSFGAAFGARASVALVRKASLFADASGRCVVERMGRRASGAAPSLTVCQGGRRKSKLPKAPFQRPLPNSSSPGRPRIFKFALGGAPPTANLPRASGSYVFKETCCV